jgi:cation diffusion facilitator family transporter
MNKSTPYTIQDSHTFNQDKKREGEVRTMIVIAITATMMVVEIASGIIFSSIALLADGLHMASHASALTITAFAYIYARRQANNRDFSFGTGKVNALGGYTGAVLLAVFALIMVWESIDRLMNPVEISFDQAIIVAILGLIVNGVSVFILGGQPGQREDHGHHHKVEGEHDDDHNLRSAYLHVLADTLTSIFAIFALLAGKYFGLTWMDPLMGIVGAVLVARWSIGLIRTTTDVLLDKQGSDALQEQIREILQDGDEVEITDLHLWSIGPNINSAIISIQTKSPRSPQYYKQQLLSEVKIDHLSIEVNPINNK